MWMVGMVEWYVLDLNLLYLPVSSGSLSISLKYIRCIHESDKANSTPTRYINSFMKFLFAGFGEEGSSLVCIKRKYPLF